MTETENRHSPDAGDVVDFLLDQHRNVERLMDNVLSSNGEMRSRYFDEVRELLARHETAEEMIVHPLTREVPAGRPVAAARMAEENEATEFLAQLEKMDQAAMEFDEKFKAFRLSVLKHAKAEEEQEFPRLRQYTDHDALVAARERVIGAEETAPAHPHPSAKTTTVNAVVGPFAALLDRARDAWKAHS